MPRKLKVEVYSYPGLKMLDVFQLVKDKGVPKPEGFDIDQKYLRGELANPIMVESGLNPIAGPGGGSDFRIIDDELGAVGVSDTGWVSPTAYTERFAGTYPWTTPANGYASDNAYASIYAPKYGPTMGVHYSGFDLSAIGDTATINGLEMKCDCYRTSVAYPPTVTTTFYQAQNIQSLANDQKFYLNVNWPLAEGTITIGSALLRPHPLEYSYPEEPIVVG